MATGRGRPDLMVRTAMILSEFEPNAAIEKAPGYIVQGMAVLAHIPGAEQVGPLIIRDVIDARIELGLAAKYIFKLIRDAKIVTQLAIQKQSDFLIAIVKLNAII